MNIAVSTLSDGPDLTGDVCIDIAPNDNTSFTFVLNRRQAEALFGKLGTVLKQVKAALEQETGEPS